MVRKDHKVSNISSEAIFSVRSTDPLRFLISIVFCLSLIFVDLRFNTSNYIRGYIQDLYSPLFFLIELPKTVLNNTSLVFSSREKLRTNLEKLKKENSKLLLLNSQLAEISKLNEELGLIWNSNPISKKSFSLARKRNLSGDSLRPILVIDVKKDKSVYKRNQAVMSTKGIIGKINSIGINTMEVMMVQDPRSMIPVISSKSRLHGIVQGSGLERKGKILNIRKTAEFVEGESLFSSGLGNTYPPNFFVGKISSVSDRPHNEFLEIEVQFLKLPLDEEFFLIHSD